MLAPDVSVPTPAAAQQNEEWMRPFEPFGMLSNIYWVGSLSTYLIGHAKSATSFTLDVRQNNRTDRVIISSMGSINPV